LPASSQISSTDRLLSANPTGRIHAALRKHEAQSGKESGSTRARPAALRKKRLKQVEGGPEKTFFIWEYVDGCRRRDYAKEYDGRACENKAELSWDS
jgi:hypothetical protein